MSNTAKSYAQNVLDGYNDTIIRLAQRYNSAVSSIDSEHDAIKAEINSNAQKNKNSADASNKVALSNTQRGLLDKGLSKSGVSIQAEIDSNMARNNAFSNIEANASKQRADNETARARSKSAALVEFINSINSAEMKKNEAYIDQLNADRAYEADRDDEKHDRYVENRAYEADRDDEKHDRYVENRAYEADRDDEKHDRYVENRAYEADRDDEKHDRYVDNRDYEAEHEDKMYDQSVSSESSGENGDDTVSVTPDESVSEENKVDPKMLPKAFVDKIRLVHESESYKSDKERKAAIKEALDKVIKDDTITFSYRYQMKIYAEALGLY